MVGNSYFGSTGMASDGESPFWRQVALSSHDVHVAGLARILPRRSVGQREGEISPAQVNGDQSRMAVHHRFFARTVSARVSPARGVQAVTTGTEIVLHNFSGADGANPYAGLVRDSKGNLYGTTDFGGSSGLGTVFKLTYCRAQQDQSNAEELDDKCGEEQ